MRGQMPRGSRGQPPDDLIQPFQIETDAARGRLVRLGPLVETTLGGHDYPEPVARLLGEMLGLAALVSAALKFEGVFTVQAKGDGPINMLVADITTDGEMRGYAQFDGERLQAADSRSATSRPVPRFLGAGYLAFTVDQGPDTDRFQGIVELDGATLAECAQNYIRQSEQLEAVVRVAAGRVGGAEDGGRCGDDRLWRVGGMMIQRLPGEGRPLMSGESRDDDAEDAWRRAVALMSCGADSELLDTRLHPNDLLYRLFHEDGVRVFRPQRLVMRCRCSEQRVVNMLRSFPRGEIADLTVGDDVVVTCEFCGAIYKFDPPALDTVYGA